MPSAALRGTATDPAVINLLKGIPVGDDGSIQGGNGLVATSPAQMCLYELRQLQTFDFVRQNPFPPLTRILCIVETTPSFEQSPTNRYL